MILIQNDMTGGMCFLLLTGGDEEKLSCVQRFPFTFEFYHPFFFGTSSSIIHPFGSIHPCVQTSIHKVISSFQIFILILYQSTNPSTQGGLRVADLSGQLSAGGQDVVQDAQDHQGKSTSAYHQPINLSTFEQWMHLISAVALDANDFGNRNDTKDDNFEKNDGNPKSNISVFFTKEVL